VPLLGLSAAFVFAAQMINFPIAGGTSGHLMGSVLVAVLLGPSAAVLVIACVLLVQALLFADGGVMVLGTNILNMALLGGVGGFAIYRMIGIVHPGRRGRVVAAAFAGWCGTVLSATAVAAELAVSGTIAWSRVFPPMVTVHMVIGAGEAIITSVVLVAIAGIRPDLVEERPRAAGAPGLRSAFPVVLGLVAGFALLVPLAAGAGPDGLERVARALGFSHLAAPPSGIPLAGYRWPAASPGLSALLAGGTGTVLAFALALLLARWLVPAPPEEAAGNPS
jgi:cobalt/nickel transport system permease protein